MGYVERDAYAAAALVARMEDEALDRAPVWDDLKTFDSEPWRGRVDLVSAGFPCQPASTAGRRAGQADERWLWPDIARVVAEVEPAYVFLENVPGLLTVNDGAAFGQVLATLAALGFDAEWDLFSAAEVGASHKRERLFLLAHSECWRCGWSDGKLERRRPERLATGPPTGVSDVAHAKDDHGRRGIREAEAGTGPDGVGRRRFAGSGTALAGSLAALFPPGPSERDTWATILAERPTLEPAVRGVADGLAHRVDRLRTAGNGVVPLVAATAFLALAGRIR